MLLEKKAADQTDAHALLEQRLEQRLSAMHARMDARLITMQALGWLEEELRPRLAEGLPRKAHLVSLAPVVADWVATHPPRAVSQSWASFLLSLVNPLTYVELVRPHTPFRRRAVA